MFSHLDDAIFERLCNPVCALVQRWLGRSCFWISAQCALAAVACYIASVAFLLLRAAPADWLSPALLAPALMAPVVAGMAHVIWRQARDFERSWPGNAANPLRLTGIRTRRMQVFVFLINALLQIAPTLGHTAITNIINIAVVGLVVAAAYFLACTPLPPIPRHEVAPASKEATSSICDRGLPAR